MLATTIACIVVSYFFNGMRQQLDLIVIRMPLENLLIAMAQLSGSESTSGLTSIVLLRKRVLGCDHMSIQRLNLVSTVMKLQAKE